MQSIGARAATAWFCVVLLLGEFAQADDPATPAVVQQAVESGLRLLTKSSRNYPNHRKCFACHHQTLPLLAVREARLAGLDVDPKLATEAGEFTGAYFKGRIELMRDGNGVPGRGMMASYGVVTLSLADQLNTEQTTSDATKTPVLSPELAEAFARYLVQTQKPDGHWPLGANRPPMEESKVTAVVLGRLALKLTSPRLNEEWKGRAEATLLKANEWLQQAPLENTEDIVMRLCGMVVEQTPADQRKGVRQKLIERQRDDGGWGQTPDMPSDAYGTGQATFALLADNREGDVEAIQKATKWLLKAQQPDGSWFVKSRAKPVQEFFDNGDPHGKDQFIAISATGWATAALAKSLQKPE